MTRRRIIAETKSDICQGKYFKVSPKIFHWHLDISPGDQCASLTVDIIPQADNAITALKATKGYFYYCLYSFPPLVRILMFKDQCNVAERDNIIAPRTFVQSASSLTALTTSINNIKSNIIIGSYCDSRSHLYISDHQISLLYTTLCNPGILSKSCC